MFEEALTLIKGVTGWPVIIPLPSGGDPAAASANHNTTRSNKNKRA